jgi:hypothetical protein
MSLSDLPPKPRYSVRGTSRRILDNMRAVQLDFYDDAIQISRFNFGVKQDSFFSPLRRAEYSDVRRCVWILPKAAQASTLGGFVWANIEAGIEISLLKFHRSGRQLSDHFWNIETLQFYSEDMPGMNEKEFRAMYSWLCDRIRAEGGKI